MADAKAGGLTVLLGADIAAGDIHLVHDISATGTTAGGVLKGTTHTQMISKLATDLAATFDPLKGADDNYVTDAQLALISAITATAAEINILDGATLTVTELNYVDGVTSSIQTQLNDKLASSTAASTYLTIANAASTYEPLKGANDNFVTDAQLAVIAVTTSANGANTGDNAVNSLYSGLVSNATHTGDVTGATALTIASTAITGKTLVTGVGSDYVLISDTSDSGNLKKCLISDFASAGGDMAAATYDPANIAQQVVGLSATQTLTNKTLTSPTLTTPVLGVASATSINKVAITAPATSATLTIADGATLTASATATVSGTNTGDNAVNSLYSGLVSNATHTGDVTGSTALTIASVAITGKTAVTAVGTDYVLISDTSDSGNLKKALVSDFTGGGGGSTFADNAFQVYDSADTSKILAFEASGITTATTRTLTVPNASGTIVLNDNTATLSNKTLTTPIIVSGGSIIDGNNNKYLQFSEVASAVNYFTIYNTATTASPFLMAEGSDTNISIRFRVKGTGALVADSTASTGGTFPRGTRAVDLQLEKTSAGQIASGANSFVVGINNTASNTAAVAMGTGCTASGIYGFSTGQNNVASGQASFCGGGDNNNATGINSAAFGTTCTASATYAIVMGRRASGYLQGQFANSNGFFAATGDSQHSFFVARHTAASITTGLTGLQLFLDGSSVAIVPNGTNRFWRVEVSWVSVVTAISGTATGVTVGDVISSTDTFTMKKLASTVTIVGTPTRDTHSDTSMSTATMVYSGSGVNLELKLTAPTFAGGGSLTLRTTATLHLTEVAY